MDASFWHDRWEAGETGFHQAEGNPLFAEHFADLALPRGKRVFLPLSGKTGDIPWLLTRGYSVVTAELSQLAIDQLFAGLGIVPRVAQRDGLRNHRAPGLDVFVGDFFDVNANILGPVDLIYDRAALVALPDTMRAQYADHLRMITQTAPQLLITFEYDQTLMEGPPFSVDAAEVSTHYAAAYDVSQLERRPLPGGLRNLAEVVEIAWLLQPKAQTDGGGA